MAATDQMHVGDHAHASRPPAFLTDDQLDRSLSQLYAGLEHVMAIVPAMMSEVARIRGQLSVTRGDRDED